MLDSLVLGSIWHLERAKSVGGCHPIVKKELEAFLLCSHWNHLFVLKDHVIWWPFSPRDYTSLVCILYLQYRVWCLAQATDLAMCSWEKHTSSQLAVSEWLRNIPNLHAVYLLLPLLSWWTALLVSKYFSSPAMSEVECISPPHWAGSCALVWLMAWELAWCKQRL